MKKIIITLTSILITVAGLAQDVFKYGGSAEDAKIVEELNEQHAKAFATANSAILDQKILSEDFILISGNGQIYRKNEVIQQVGASKSASQNILSHSMENVAINFIAPDVTMVHAKVKFKMKDGTVTSGVQYNDIYAKRNGQWWCVSGNNVTLATGNK